MLFRSAEPTGTYGPLTVDAVSKFQEAHGLNQLGVVGPATRAALNAILAGGTTPSPTSAPIPSSTGARYIFEHFMGVGDDDPDVLELQKRLVELGYLSATPTGYYGNATDAAVRKFQTAKGLPVTGYFAKDTRAVLNR